MRLESLFEKNFTDEELDNFLPALFQQLDLTETMVDLNYRIPGTFRVSVVWRYDDHTPTELAPA